MPRRKRRRESGKDDDAGDEPFVALFPKTREFDAERIHCLEDRFPREAGSMGYNVTSWEMIRTREEKLSFDDDQHAIVNNMVDARACYKPSGKVSVEFERETRLQQP